MTSYLSNYTLHNVLCSSDLSSWSAEHEVWKSTQLFTRLKRLTAAMHCADVLRNARSTPVASRAVLPRASEPQSLLDITMLSKNVPSTSADLSFERLVEMFKDENAELESELAGVDMENAVAAQSHGAALLRVLFRERTYCLLNVLVVLETVLSAPHSSLSMAAKRELLSQSFLLDVFAVFRFTAFELESTVERLPPWQSQRTVELTLLLEIVFTVQCLLNSQISQEEMQSFMESVSHSCPPEASQSVVAKNLFVASVLQYYAACEEPFRNLENLEFLLPEFAWSMIPLLQGILTLKGSSDTWLAYYENIIGETTELLLDASNWMRPGTRVLMSHTFSLLINRSLNQVHRERVAIRELLRGSADRTDALLVGLRRFDAPYFFLCRTLLFERRSDLSSTPLLRYCEETDDARLSYPCVLPLVRSLEMYVFSDRGGSGEYGFDSWPLSCPLVMSWLSNAGASFSKLQDVFGILAQFSVLFDVSSVLSMNPILSAGFALHDTRNEGQVRTWLQENQEYNDFAFNQLYGCRNSSISDSKSFAVRYGNRGPHEFNYGLAIPLCFFAAFSQDAGWWNNSFKAHFCVAVARFLRFTVAFASATEELDTLDRTFAEALSFRNRGESLFDFCLSGLAMLSEQRNDLLKTSISAESAKVFEVADYLLATCMDLQLANYMPSLSAASNSTCRFLEASGWNFVSLFSSSSRDFLSARKPSKLSACELRSWTDVVTLMPYWIRNECLRRRGANSRVDNKFVYQSDLVPSITQLVSAVAESYLISDVCDRCVTHGASLGVLDLARMLASAQSYGLFGSSEIVSCALPLFSYALEAQVLFAHAMPAFNIPKVASLDVVFRSEQQLLSHDVSRHHVIARLLVAKSMSFWLRGDLDVTYASRLLTLCVEHMLPAMLRFVVHHAKFSMQHQVFVVLVQQIVSWAERVPPSSLGSVIDEVMAMKWVITIGRGTYASGKEKSPLTERLIRRLSSASYDHSVLCLLLPFIEAVLSWSPSSILSSVRDPLIKQVALVLSKYVTSDNFLFSVSFVKFLLSCSQQPDFVVLHKSMSERRPSYLADLLRLTVQKANEQSVEWQDCSVTVCQAVLHITTLQSAAVSKDIVRECFVLACQSLSRYPVFSQNFLLLAWSSLDLSFVDVSLFAPFCEEVTDGAAFLCLSSPDHAPGEELQLAYLVGAVVRDRRAVAVAKDWYDLMQLCLSLVPEGSLTLSIADAESLSLALSFMRLTAFVFFRGFRAPYVGQVSENLFMRMLSSLRGLSSLSASMVGVRSCLRHSSCLTQLLELMLDLASSCHGLYMSQNAALLVSQVTMSGIVDVCGQLMSHASLLYLTASTVDDHATRRFSHDRLAALLLNENSLLFFVSLMEYDVQFLEPLLTLLSPLPLGGLELHGVRDVSEKSVSLSPSAHCFMYGMPVVFGRFVQTVFASERLDYLLPMFIFIAQAFSKHPVSTSVFLAEHNLLDAMLNNDAVFQVLSQESDLSHLASIYVVLIVDTFLRSAPEYALRRMQTTLSSFINVRLPFIVSGLLRSFARPTFSNFVLMERVSGLLVSLSRSSLLGDTLFCEYGTLQPLRGPPRLSAVVAREQISMDHFRSLYFACVQCIALCDDMLRDRKNPRNNVFVWSNICKLSDADVFPQFNRVRVLSNDKDDVSFDSVSPFFLTTLDGNIAVRKHVESAPRPSTGNGSPLQTIASSMWNSTLLGSLYCRRDYALRQTDALSSHHIPRSRVILMILQSVSSLCSVISRTMSSFIADDFLSGLFLPYSVCRADYVRQRQQQFVLSASNVGLDKLSAEANSEFSFWNDVVRHALQPFMDHMNEIGGRLKGDREGLYLADIHHVAEVLQVPVEFARAHPFVARLLHLEPLLEASALVAYESLGAAEYAATVAITVKARVVRAFTETHPYAKLPQTLGSHAAYDDWRSDAHDSLHGWLMDHSREAEVRTACAGAQQRMLTPAIAALERTRHHVHQLNTKYESMVTFVTAHLTHFN